MLKIFIAAAIGAIAAMITMALYRAREPVSQDVVFSKGYAVRRFWLAIVLAVAVAAFVVSIPHFPYPSAATSGRTYTDRVARRIEASRSRTSCRLIHR